MTHVSQYGYLYPTFLMGGEACVPLPRSPRQLAVNERDFPLKQFSGGQLRIFVCTLAYKAHE